MSILRGEQVVGQRRLFRIGDSWVHEIEPSASRLERHLQVLFERYLDDLLGIRFLASEYVTGADHGGRIDTLGLDENDCPVIIEYKRQTNENIISQVLFYLDWLLKNRAEFELLVLKKIGVEASKNIDFDGTRLLCIAGDYAKYDLHAVNRVGPNVEMIAYRHYGGDLLLLDYVTGLRRSVKTVSIDKTKSSEPPEIVVDPASTGHRISRGDGALTVLFDGVRDRILGLGEDMQVVELKGYYAFKRLRNVACVGVQPGKGAVTMYLRVDPGTVRLEPGFTRDMSGKGHYGTGDLEVVIKSEDDLERAMPYLRTSYEVA